MPHFSKLANITMYLLLNMPFFSEINVKFIYNGTVCALLQNEGEISSTASSYRETLLIYVMNLHFFCGMRALQCIYV